MEEGNATRFWKCLQFTGNLSDYEYNGSIRADGYSDEYTDHSGYVTHLVAINGTVVWNWEYGNHGVQFEEIPNGESYIQFYGVRKW